MDTEEWVEIIEPASREHMFANLKTGEVVWDPPEGVHVKTTDDNQWWELYDEGTKRFYYYNGHTQTTVWKKPPNADIIPLAMLQKVITKQQEQEQLKLQGRGGKGSHGETNQAEQESNPEVIGDAQTPDSGNATDNSTEDRLESEDHHPLETQSQPPETKNGQPDAALPDPAGQSAEPTLNETCDEMPAVSEDVTEVPDVFEAPVSPSGALASDEERKEEPAAKQLSPAVEEEGVCEKDGGRSYQFSPSPSFSGRKRGLSTKMELLRAKLEDRDRSKSMDHTSDHVKSESPRRPSASSPLSPAPLLSPTGGIPVAPVFVLPPKTAESRIEQYDQISQHKRGLFRKKVSIANMLSWTRDSIGQPMIKTRDKKMKKEAVDLFKLLQMYMGDKRTKKDALKKLGLDIVVRGWSTPSLRDELYIQLARQTTGNIQPQSLLRGWELLSTCLGFFPPSPKFAMYLEGYFYRHLEPEKANYKGVPVSVHANHCYKRLERMVQAGAKKGLKKPTAEEVEQAKTAPFNPSMFGSTLDDVMEIQNKRFPDIQLPWLVPTLSQIILDRGAQNTEGIFRVPGDIDEVNSMKTKIDSFEVPKTRNDPHVPASLLKLWFRELYFPLIPANYYDECIYNCDHIANAISVANSLPNLNRQLLLYTVRFLQEFTRAEVVAVTKMDISNLAMVWAPNFLRCPSSDPKEIYDNTRMEMTFLRTLMENWDTSEIEGVV
eukprot:m.91897 g.91897  ORF g.91897 m.91897 type:complete len:718 (+) comp36709_c0_seq23:192-2345(+)